MRIYIAGKLSDNSEKEFLEKLADLCESIGFETFLPHRDVGIAESTRDIQKIFEGDIIEGFKDCKLIVADLNGLHVGAGTAWELGYAYAKKIPAIGIKTDETVEDSLDYLSAILLGSMKMVTSLEELEVELKKIRHGIQT